ncbi:Fungal specific transcription factor domain-containing protein isoform 1 [Cladophialophora immunda]|nr:Fungal specific transcription factor domain-containing protein isoform 1 [Cladophialophora immunda]
MTKTAISTMAGNEKSRFLFVVSTPRQLDQGSLKKNQAAARAHAAKVSHPSTRAQSSSKQQQSGHQVFALKSPLEDPSASSDRELDEQYLAASVSTDRPAIPPTSRAQPSFRQSRSRTVRAHPKPRRLRASRQPGGRPRDNKQDHRAAKPCPPALSVDPLYWLPYDKDENAYQAVDYFANIAAPALRPVYEIFNITSVYTSLFLECITDSESFYHAGVARLCATADLLRNPRSKPALSVLLHQAKAITHLRHEIERATQPTNMMLATILFLIAIDIAIGQGSSADMHRINLARLVKARGGLDALGRDGFEKATFMQFDNMYALERGPSILVSLQRYRPRYPPFPLSPRLIKIISAFPDGFRCLVHHRLLPLDVIELLFRISATVRRCADSNTYVPFNTAENPFHSKRRKYDSFSDACPWLFAPEDKVHPLLKPLTMAMVLWCCNAYSTIRASTVVYAGFLRALTMLLLRSPIMPMPPTAKFPGTKLAALTLWYEFYYDVLKRGQYMFKIREMHRKYGPIVRISPYELHVNDPTFLPVLYAGGTRRRDKYAWATRLFGSSDAAIATVGHDMHRMRRGAMNRYFSKESIRRLEPIINRNVEKLAQKLAEFKGSARSLNVNLPFGAFTSDIITEYCFGQSRDWLDKPGFNEKFIEMMASVHDLGAAAKQFNFLILVDMLPDWFVEKQDAGMAAFIQFRRVSFWKESVMQAATLNS